MAGGDVGQHRLDSYLASWACAPLCGWIEPAPVLVVALGQVGWQLCRTLVVRRSLHLEADLAYVGKVVMTPLPGLYPLLMRYGLMALLVDLVVVRLLFSPLLVAVSPAMSPRPPARHSVNWWHCLWWVSLLHLPAWS